MSLTSGLMAAADEVPADPAGTATVAYSRIADPVLRDSPSLALGSVGLAAVGSQIAFAEDTPRDLAEVSFVLANWSCQEGYGDSAAGCTTTDPDATFDVDITVTIFEVDRSGESVGVGPVIAQHTETVAVPYRPSADPERCTEYPGDHFDEVLGDCRPDIKHAVTFDDFANVMLPDEAIVQVSYDTPWPSAAHTLNVGLDRAGTAAVVGTESDTLGWLKAGGVEFWGDYNRLQIEVRTDDAVPVPDTAAYSRVPETLAPSYPSLGFQATQIHELANVVSLADGPSRDLTEVEVIMASWACETGSGVTCVTTPGATFTHPVTVNLYEVAGTAEVPAPGALIASRTIRADMAYRPSASNEQCTLGRWYDEASETCNNGFAYPLVFDNFGDVTLPDDVVVGIRFETFNTTGIHGPFESMNVAVEPNRTTVEGEAPVAIAPRLGAEPTVDSLIRWSSTGPNKGVPLIWADYAEHSPMIEIRTALDADATLTAPAEVYALQDVTPVVTVTGAGIPVDGTVTVAAFVGEGAATCSGDPAEILEVDVADLATADLAFSTVLPGTMGFAAMVDTFRGDNVTTTDCATTEVRAFFTDAGGDHPFFQQIQWLGVTGLSTGYADGTYRPAAPVSRQATAAFLARWLEGDALAACDEGPFTDVPADHGFCKEIQWMETEGLSLGYEDGSFQPAATVTRQAGAAFLARAIGGELPACTEAPFPDVPTDHAFCPQIQWMKAEGVASGYADGTFGPTLPMTRQAMAAWVHAANGLLPD